MNDRKATHERERAHAEVRLAYNARLRALEDLRGAQKAYGLS